LLRLPAIVITGTFRRLGGRMIFDLITYSLLGTIFVVNTLRMFIDKPNNALQTAQLPWERLLRRRQKADADASDV
jgi:hypothetical protein